MKPFIVRKLCFMLLFALESSILIKTCFGEGGSKRQIAGSTWTVTIINYQTNSNLTAHCKSKDDDLGEHVIGMKGQYSWTFKENFWQTTLYWCDFSSLNGHVSFEVFWPEKGDWLSRRCNYENCRWAAFNEGFCLANLPLKKLELLHPWIKTPDYINNN